MAKLERVLRMSGVYHRKKGVSEEEFHRFSRYHAVVCAKIHEKHGLLKYQIVRDVFLSCLCSFFSPMMRTGQQLFQCPSFRSEHMTPYEVNTHDLEIEYYFKDVATLLAISNDEEFKRLHGESEPSVDHDTAKVTITWIDIYVENEKMVKINLEGESLYAPVADLAKVEKSEKSVGKIYEK
ncbi:hypothetical protein RRF57_013261 [Xylaria bambusicola]|uniref:EthD domain-containing protein n=1 Tax=Xylaria bambusicola TaxID=326684 RepID=A0AAN7V2M4_9PEZI